MSEKFKFRPFLVDLFHVIFGSWFIDTCNLISDDFMRRLEPHEIPCWTSTFFQHLAAFPTQRHRLPSPAARPDYGPWGGGLDLKKRNSTRFCWEKIGGLQKWDVTVNWNTNPTFFNSRMCIFWLLCYTWRICFWWDVYFILLFAVHVAVWWDLQII